MAWQLLAAALPAAAKVAGTALSKPKEEDFKPQTDYMKKYLSYLRGRTADREVAHMAMQPALRVAGRQGRQAQRQVGYDVAQSGLEGSGIEAQMRLSAGQQTQDALATATDKAVAAQTAETARVGEKAAGITAQIQAEEARADQAFKTATSNWKKQMASDIIGGVASVASAGMTQYGQNIEGFNQAKMAGAIGSDVTYDQFKQQAKTGVVKGVEELGLSDRQLENVSPATYAQYLGANEQLVNDLRLSSRYLGGDAGVKKLMEQGYKPEQIARIGKESHEIYVNNIGKVDDATISRAVGFPVQTNPGLDDVITSMSQDNSATVTPPTTTNVTPSTTNNVTTVDPSKTTKEVIDKVVTDPVVTDPVVTDPATTTTVTTEPVETESAKLAKKGKEAGDFAREEMKKKGKGKIIETWEDREIAKIQSLIAEGEEKEKRKETTEKVLARGAKRAEQKALKGRVMDINRKGKDYKVVVDDVDLENDKITFTHTGGKFTNKKRTVSLDKFDEYRGVTNMANKKIDPIFSTVQKFEQGDRSKRHNNIGAVVWTENLQKKHPKMEKGDSFVDRDGVTRYTAKFPDKETGDRINRQIMQEMLESVGGDTAKFYARWSGLPENSETVQNFVKEVGG
tara:strand:- start:1758 stop:3635 length:1878 start_codon:yes stop_codon:yes gene_type:complete